MKTVADTLGVARSGLAATKRPASAPRGKTKRGRPPQDETELLNEIKGLIATRQSYGYRRVWAMLRRDRIARGLEPWNHKRVYRVMKGHGLLLERHFGKGEERHHDGRVAVAERNTRWCSDGFEIGCDNGERVRIAFVMDCCDREVMSHVATTGGITGEMVRDLMVEATERRFGPVNRLPATIEWLSDNGSCYTAAETRGFAKDIGFKPVTTPIESPQSNGMAEALVKTIKRDYAKFAKKPDAERVLESLHVWFEDYNTIHPHKALGYRSPREFIATNASTQEMGLSDL
jgi:putative transposase